MQLLHLWKTVNNNSEEREDKLRALLGREDVIATFQSIGCAFSL